MSAYTIPDSLDITRCPYSSPSALVIADYHKRVRKSTQAQEYYRFGVVLFLFVPAHLYPLPPACAEASAGKQGISLECAIQNPSRSPPYRGTGQALYEREKLGRCIVLLISFFLNRTK